MATYFVARKLAAGGQLPESLKNQNLKGKTVIVTGANVGIGKETALQMAE